MLPLKPPTAEEAFRGQVASAFNDIDELIAQPTNERYEEAAHKLLETHDAVDLVAALLNTITKDDASQVPVKITPEKPLPRRHRGHNNYRHRNNHRGKYRGHSHHGYHRNDNCRDGGRHKKHRFNMRRKEK